MEQEVIVCGREDSSERMPELFLPPRAEINATAFKT
jgi:hypothetical protein